MKVIADLCVVPIGVGVSVSKYVTACEEVLKEAGLKTKLHAYGTNIEGEWEAVFAAIRRCHEVVHEMGAPRITTTLKFGTRTDRTQTMEVDILPHAEAWGFFWYLPPLRESYTKRLSRCFRAGWIVGCVTAASRVRCWHSPV